MQQLVSKHCKLLDYSLLVLIVILSLIIFFKEKGLVPLHANFDGRLGNYVDKKFIFVIPVLAFGQWMVLDYLEKKQTQTLTYGGNSIKKEISSKSYLSLIKIFSLLLLFCFLVTILYPNDRYLIQAILVVLTVSTLIFLVKGNNTGMANKKE